jgi:hypothetical protein
MGLTRSEAMVAQKVLSGQQSQTKFNAYYSRVRFTTTLASLVYTVSKGQNVTAFGYGIGQDMATAGQSGNAATPADTNLTSANQTVSGECLLIRGIGLIVLCGSDAHLVKQSDGQISCQLNLNGGNPVYKLGVPSMLPGPGGFFGRSDAPSVGPSPAEVTNGNIGALSNGMPVASNYFPFEEPIIWRPAGSPDSSLNVQLRSEYQFATNANYGLATRSALAGVTSSFTGTNAYTPPTAAATYIDFLVVLIGVTINPLSGN